MLLVQLAASSTAGTVKPGHQNFFICLCLGGFSALPCGLFGAFAGMQLIQELWVRHNGKSRIGLAEKGQAVSELPVTHNPMLAGFDEPSCVPAAMLQRLNSNQT